MMTLREVAPPEGISSSSAHATTIDPQKAKVNRRRRIEIRKFRSSCREQVQNGAVYTTTVNMNVHADTWKSTCGAHGAVSVMGRRREMEDAVKVERCFVEAVGRCNKNNNNDNDNNSNSSRNSNIKKYDYFGVYDGHGGSHVAEACRDRMHAILAEEVIGKDTWSGAVVDWEVVIGKCFERMDTEVVSGRAVEEVEEMTVGSTVVAAVVGDEEVVVANCGDSRAVLCRNGVAVPLSSDHKPDRPDELARIEAAGGRVINWNGFRVLGVLATSRSIGDHYLKPYVSSIPEVTITTRSDSDEFLILASDGLWDVISNDVACNVVRRCLFGRLQRKVQEFTNGICKFNGSSKAEIAAALLTELAIAKGSKDNISVIVVELRNSGKSNNCS